MERGGVVTTRPFPLDAFDVEYQHLLAVGQAMVGHDGGHAIHFECPPHAQG
jgi:hypothetical protein